MKSVYNILDGIMNMKKGFARWALQLSTLFHEQKRFECSQNILDVWVRKLSLHDNGVITEGRTSFLLNLQTFKSFYYSFVPKMTEFCGNMKAICTDVRISALNFRLLSHLELNYLFRYTYTLGVVNK